MTDYERGVEQASAIYKVVIREYVTENSRLRGLVEDLLTCVSEGDWDCSDCPRYARCDDGVSEFIDRARELGIGAPE